MATATERILITGGAGFIGSNAARNFLQQGREVVVVDNLFRAGSQINLSWLEKSFGGSRFKFCDVDIRDEQALTKVVLDFKPEVVVHNAAQVAVTDSFRNPRLDFEINELGTFNLIEAARQLAQPPVVVFSGTNKEYGDFPIDLEMEAKRYSPVSTDPLVLGVPESLKATNRTPYGVSKGSASQRINDAYESFGIPTIVARQSCIYGDRQFGSVDQGWVYILAEQAHRNDRLTIFGDGKQVRDLLYVDDLISFYQLAIENGVAYGQIYNVGGGVKNTMSLLENIEWLSNHLQRSVRHGFGDWRPHDQKWYVSDISKAKRDLGWEPKIGVDEGLKRLDQWVHQQIVD